MKLMASIRNSHSDVTHTEKSSMMTRTISTLLPNNFKIKSYKGRTAKSRSTVDMILQGHFLST